MDKEFVDGRTQGIAARLNIHTRKTSNEHGVRAKARQVTRGFTQGEVYFSLRVLPQHLRRLVSFVGFYCVKFWIWICVSLMPSKRPSSRLWKRVFSCDHLRVT